MHRDIAARMRGAHLAARVLATAALCAASRAAIGGAAEPRGVPPRLADTGLYSDFASRTVAPGNLHFSPQYPLWTDMSRFLSGHPETLAMPPAPSQTAPWLASGSATFTAWGPWGVSFTANLTPDPETGLGKWTEQNFIEAIRTGRHQGRGRPILPPMPWEQYRIMSDADLKAVFAYLRTIPPIRNRVPDPVPPPGAPTGTGSGAGPGEGAAPPTR